MNKSFYEYLKEDKSEIYPSARQAYEAGQQTKQAVFALVGRFCFSRLLFSLQAVLD